MIITKLNGIVVHVRRCAGCDGEGRREVLACGHFTAGCDCTTTLGRCEDCNGRGTVEDEDCDCDDCMAAFRLAELRRAATC